MKIYRFLPNARDYGVVTKTLAGRWWPDGIEMGRKMRELFPKLTDAWPHEGNRYDHDPEEVPLSDFPAFALNVPVVSRRAAEVLKRARLVSEFVPMTVSGEPFFAVQPQILPDVFDAERSRGLTFPNGEVFHYYLRSFDTSKVAAEFFAIPELQPFSDLYVTERLLREAEAAGLTGLEYVELVYDEDGPFVPVYPAEARARADEFTYRRRLEWELLYWRGSLRWYDEEVIDEAIGRALAAGLVSYVYVRPEYRRDAPPELRGDEGARGHDARDRESLQAETPPRLGYVDPRWGARMADYNDAARREIAREAEGGSATQLDYAMLADHCLDLGLFRYALGAPLGEVREALGEAARFYLKVFELRGTQPAFDATLVTLDARAAPLPAAYEPEEWEAAETSDESDERRRALHPPGAVDYSLTNSKKGMLAACAALAAGDVQTARAVAALVEDPPGASYLGEGSVVCTFDEQRLAYAFKSLLTGAEGAAGLELSAAASAAQRHEAEMILALAGGDSRLFLEGLAGLLREHGRDATAPEAFRVPETYLSLHGLGLAACALRAGLIEPGQLPADDVYLPRELLTGAAED
ncbi:MAG TPA: hypothetical protein VN282_24205 [Pyrinomonadaceae bacterium]|nr:hypothetical protein [Pyrinomonadaceae bacterium]